jgi:peptidoglycan/xylan/chitin deacetylase (PgdA/CDA1 family)
MPTGYDDTYVTEWGPSLRDRGRPLRRAREAVRGPALSLLGRVARDTGGPFLRCLYCHYVFDDQVAAFRRILEALAAVGTFVDTATCVAMLGGERPIDDRYFHLSFDDGFRNVVANAVPVLNELKIPAVTFVPSALVGAGWDATKRYSTETTGHRGVIEVVRWDDLRAMSAYGVEVGSHTRTHARLSSLADPARLRDEVEGSKREIEDRLGVECRYFAWPFGRLADAGDRAIESVEDAGYRASFGAFRGSVRPGQVADAFRIPRHHFEPHWPVDHVRYFAAGNNETAPPRRRAEAETRRNPEAPLYEAS